MEAPPPGSSPRPSRCRRQHRLPQALITAQWCRCDPRDALRRILAIGLCLLTLLAGSADSTLGIGAAHPTTLPKTGRTTQLATKRAAASSVGLMRLSVFASPDAYRHPHLALLTLGGANYCGLLLSLARAVAATRICVDYARFATAEPQKFRIQDFGAPAYLAAV